MSVREQQGATALQWRMGNGESMENAGSQMTNGSHGRAESRIPEVVVNPQNRTPVGDSLSPPPDLFRSP
ncbi:MAG: hypothetical protein ACK58L_14080 [Planctomycetota bacterium]